MLWESFAEDIGLSTVLLLTWYFGIRNFTTDKSEKKSSWIMTLLCAIVGVSSSIPVFQSFYESHMVLDHSFLYGQGSREIVFSVRFFTTYFLIDSFFMYLHYPSICNMVSWLHHIAYFLCMGWSLAFDCSMIFAVFFPIEISTLFLASGYILFIRLHMLSCIPQVLIHAKENYDV